MENEKISLAILKCSLYRLYSNQAAPSELSDRNLHGRVEAIAGVRIAALGGVFREKVWKPGGDAPAHASQAEFLKSCGKGNLWRGGLPLKQRSTIFPSDIASLKKKRADILVTHEAPDLHPFGSSALTELAKSLNVQAAFHGHHHEDIQYPGGIWRGVAMREIAVFKVATTVC